MIKVKKWYKIRKNWDSVNAEFGVLNLV